MQLWWFCKACRSKVPLGGIGQAKRRHMKSARHRKAPRIRALLRQPGVTYNEIAAKTGLMPETIRQFALRLDPLAHRGGLNHRFWTCRLCRRKVPAGPKGKARIRHLKSSRHLQARRIRALLRQACLSYAEIGRRVGLTAETIRQIDMRTFSPKPRGVERRISCTVNRHLSAWWKRNKNSPVLAHLTERGYRAEPIPSRDPNGNIRGYHRHKAVINGKVVAWRRFSEIHNGGREYLGMSVPHGPDSRDIDFAIYHLRDERFYIFPSKQLQKLRPRIAFADDPAYQRGRRYRNDCRDFREAWSLIPSKKGRCAETPTAQAEPLGPPLTEQDVALDVGRCLEAWWARHMNEPAIIRLNQHGFIAEPVPCATAFLGYYHDRVSINGAVVAWRPIYETAVKRKRYLRLVMARDPSPDFTIFYLQNKLFYVFSKAYLKARPRQTMFAYDPTPRWGNHKDHHGYRDYRDAWQLLPRKNSG